MKANGVQAAVCELLCVLTVGVNSGVPPVKALTQMYYNQQD